MDPATVAQAVQLLDVTTKLLGLVFKEPTATAIPDPRPELQQQQQQLAKLEQEVRSFKQEKAMNIGGTVSSAINLLVHASNLIQIARSFQGDKVSDELKSQLKERDRQLRILQNQLDTTRRYATRDAAIVAQLRAEAKRELGINDDQLNVMITGPTGAGKSTLINEMCGWKIDEKCAAKVGEIDTTRDIKRYQYPSIKRLQLWDCPGANSPDHPLDSYFEMKYLYVFSLLVIVYKDRFTITEIDLIRQAKAFDVPVILVRNRMNDDFRSRKRRCIENTPEIELRLSLISDCKDEALKNLKPYEVKLDTKTIFCINAWALSDPNELCFEEGKLKKYICDMAVENDRSKSE